MNRDFVVIDCRNQPLRLQRFFGRLPQGGPLAVPPGRPVTRTEVEYIRLGRFTTRPA